MVEKRHQRRDMAADGGKRKKKFFPKEDDITFLFLFLFLPFFRLPKTYYYALLIDRVENIRDIRQAIYLVVFSFLGI
jgi:hypothetical protein